MANLSSVFGGVPVVEARPLNTAVIVNVGGGLLSLSVTEAESISAELMAAVDQVHAHWASARALPSGGAA